ncbi:MAG: hypothetical protein WKG01_19375 [Kofleriaceae bacterium]
MKLLLSVLLLAAACGGSSKPAPQPTPEPAPAEPAPAPVAEAKPDEPAAPDPAAVKAELMATETAAFVKAKPVFDKFCQGCHVKGQKNASAKKLNQLDLTAYPFTGEHSKASDLRDVLGLSGKKATMPKTKPGAVKGDDLGTIIAWADAWDAAEAGGAHAK